MKKHPKIGQVDKERLIQIKSILDESKILLNQSNLQTNFYNRIFSEWNIVFSRLNLIRDKLVSYRIGFVRLQKVKLALDANFNKFEKIVLIYKMKNKNSSEKKVKEFFSNYLRGQLLEITEGLEFIVKCLEPLIDQVIRNFGKK